MEGGGESISIKQAIRSSYRRSTSRPGGAAVCGGEGGVRRVAGQGVKAGRGCVWVEGREPRGVLRELCLRAVCVVVAGVAWAGVWRGQGGCGETSQMRFESVFCR